MTQFLLLTKHTVSGNEKQKESCQEYIRDVSTLVVGGEVADINLTITSPLIIVPPPHARP
jgi:hypothetical protein